MSERALDPYNVACGERLKHARQALGHNRRTFARMTLAEDDSLDSVKRAEARLEKWEKGINGVPSYYIRKLKPLFGIDMNYIYDDDLTGLPPDLRTKIIEQRRGQG